MMSPGIRLRLLGSAALERDGVPVTGRATQRMRIALLALLAQAPTRSVTRDRLVALLWPEADTENARHLLAGAIYDLRRALGEDAVISRGDDVELSGAIEVDTGAFEQAARAGDLAGAVDRWTGPLLDGFHISDSPEFEKWLDGERDRLTRLHADALEALARERALADDVAGAVAMWRRLAALDPYNSRIALELMLALDAAGDRAAALRHARTHEVLLTEEFGAAPDEAITALAERLRSGAGMQPTARGPAAVPASPADVAPSVVALTPASPEPLAARTPVRARRIRTTPWRRHRLLIRLAAAALLVLLVVSAAAAVRTVLSAGRRPTDAVRRDVSIAVLPFRDLSEARDRAVLADALSDEIISALGRVPELLVAARTSSFVFRDAADVREVGRSLGVTHVLEGTVRGTAERVTVTAGLIDARTGYRVWSEVLSAPWQMRDIVAVQEEIAQSVVHALELRLGGRAAPAALVAPTTDDLEAFNDYQAGRQAFYRRTPENILLAKDLFERAVERDSSYAIAHAGIAEAYVVLGGYDYGVLPPRVAYPAARVAAERALSLQPDLAEAHTALGGVHFNYDWDWDAAGLAFNRALVANPGYAPAHHWQSLLHAARGRIAEARAAAIRAAELDPLSLVMRSAVARQHYYARDFARAIDQYRRVLDIDSSFVTARLGLGMTLMQVDSTAAAIAEFEAAHRILGATIPVMHGVLGYAHGRAGNLTLARQHLAGLEASRVRNYVPAEYLLLVYVGLRDADAAFASLQAAVANRSGGIAYLRADPLLDPLRDDARFAKLIHDNGL